jgi:endonuclease YncB( thermonuclease family)
MKERFLNFFTIIFVGIFSCAIIATIVVKNKTAPNPAISHSAEIEFKNEFSGVAFAIDGDSLKVGENEVRLLGIDAPEYRQNCFNSKNQEYACGQASHKFLIDLAGKKNVQCFYNQKDRYNRFLAKCYVGEVSINEEILKNGMAVIYDFKNSEAKYDALEESAKKQKLGIWQGKFQLPKEYRKSHPRSAR